MCLYIFERVVVDVYMRRQDFLSLFGYNTVVKEYSVGIYNLF